MMLMLCGDGLCMVDNYGQRWLTIRMFADSDDGGGEDVYGH